MKCLAMELITIRDHYSAYDVRKSRSFKKLVDLNLYYRQPSQPRMCNHPSFFEMPWRNSRQNTNYNNASITSPITEQKRPTVGFVNDAIQYSTYRVRVRQPKFSNASKNRYVTLTGREMPTVLTNFVSTVNVRTMRTTIVYFL